MGCGVLALIVGAFLVWLSMPVIRNPSSLDKHSLLYRWFRRATLNVEGRRELGIEPRPDEIRFWAIMLLVVAIGFVIAGLVGILFPY